VEDWISSRTDHDHCNLHRRVATPSSTSPQGSVPPESRYFTETLARGLRILLEFHEGALSLSLGELSARTGLDKATTLRLVNTLHSVGFLERSPATRRYRPGLGVLRLGYAALAASSLHDSALPQLEVLAAATGETVNMGVLVGDSVLYVERLKRAELVTANIQVGSTLPAYCTSMGKMLLATGGPAAASILDAGRFEPLGPKTIVDSKALAIELKKIQRRGWASQDEEVAPGLLSIAAPIRDETSKVIAAINIAVPSSRFTMRRLVDEFLPLLMESANVISEFSGYRTSAPAATNPTE